MTTLRLDENSTTSDINEVLDMKVGSVFRIAPEFMEQFKLNIPDNKCFKFIPIAKDSVAYKKYGSDSYIIICNSTTIML